MFLSRFFPDVSSYLTEKEDDFEIYTKKIEQVMHIGYGIFG